MLDAVSLTIGPRARVGVVAPNGAGKTTLLRILGGLDRSDSGSVRLMPPDATIGYLPQEPERRAGETLRGYLGRRTGVTDAESALEAAAGDLAGGREGAGDAYSAALDRYLALGGPDLDARTGEACADVGVPERLLDAEMTSLSGGEAARASLVAILLSRYDLYLLDEPTNDLDFAGLDRLERFLDDVPGGAVVVSHDRAFLDRTIGVVIEIDDHTHRVTAYAGGWTAYVEERATARRHAEEDYAEFHAKRDTLERRARTQKQWAAEGARKARKSTKDEPDKYVRGWKSQRSEQLAAKVRITEKSLERLDVVEKPWEGWDLRLEIAAAPRSGAVVTRLTGAVVSRGEFALGPVDLEIGWGERVAILGANGSGKTTLLRVILGRVALDSGERWIGRGVEVGELDQARGRFLSDEPLLGAFEGETAMATSEARSLLAKLGLGSEHVERPASTLSPGERTRAELALLTARGVNCLVLDEPTNHLDLPAIEQLEKALETFGGTLLLVSHDRRMLDAVSTTRRIELEGGRVIADSPT
ncbi:MAG: ATP-binding cassette domain-containing protein [Acidimicrobiia bacterium]|nr:ATP-binding cassette domain-containing protein [Acidimicrobiia bacterium]